MTRGQETDEENKPEKVNRLGWFDYVGSEFRLQKEASDRPDIQKNEWYLRDPERVLRMVLSGFEPIPLSFRSRLPKLTETMLSTRAVGGFLLLLLLNGYVLGIARPGIGLKPLDFFRFSDEELGREVKLSFHPDEGLRLRENFQKKYGTRGEELIKSLGEGPIFVTNNIRPGS